MTSAHGDLLVGHDGVKKCKEGITECYVWPDMDIDLKKMSKMSSLKKGKV